MQTKPTTDTAKTGKLYRKIDLHYRGKYLCSSSQFKTQRAFREYIIALDKHLDPTKVKTTWGNN